ncbi:MAG: JAB domain-containing protein [Monoglobales bacterium]
MPNENPENGHRQRVREKYQKLCSFESYAPYEVLEFLLFHAIPRRDTKTTAKNLISTFGSLEAVLRADIDLLKKQSGIGSNAAVFLHSLGQLMLYLPQQESKVIKGSGDVGAYAVNLMKGKTVEEFFALAITPKNEIVNTKNIATGRFSSVSADVRELVRFAINSDVDKIIIIHNHTNGSPLPSCADVKVTRHLIDITASLGITIADHIITGHDSYYSMADSGIIKKGDPR